MMYMVRKQLYLTEAQDVALKNRADALGVSEAELVRRALDAALGGRVAAVSMPGREEAIARLRVTWPSRTSRLDAPFSRDELYDQRLEQMAGHGDR